MSTIDTVIVFRILKKLTTPFDKTPAYKLGLIDKKGKKIKNAETDEEKREYFDDPDILESKID